MADYTSPAVAFAQGDAAAQQAADNFRKNKAMKALENIYGPVAGDPQDAIANQNYLQSTIMDPLKVKAQELANTGTATANDQAAENLDFSKKVDPLKLQGAQNEVNQGGIKTQQDQLDLDTNRSLDPLKVDAARLANQGAAINNQGGTIANATAGENLASLRGLKERQAAAGLLATLTNTYNNGGDLGATFDQMAPQIAAFEGVDPAHLGPLKDLLLRDPKGTIDKLQQALAATAPPTAGGRAGSAAAAANTPQARSQQADALDVIHERTAAVPTTIDQANALIPKMSGSAIIRKARAQIPGTPEYQFEQLVHSISSNLSLDDLRAVRQSGLSLGRTNIAEFQASANAFGNLDLGQDPAQLAGVLGRLKGSYGQINSNIAADIARLRSGGIGGTTTAAPGGKPTGGTSAPLSDADLLKKYGIGG